MSQSRREEKKDGYKWREGIGWRPLVFAAVIVTVPRG